VPGDDARGDEPHHARRNTEHDRAAEKQMATHRQQPGQTAGLD
jgi:hypothetical protein